MKTRDLALCGLFTALLAICSWISIPLGNITFTLQTFAIFLALFLLGGRLAAVTVFAYLLLGAVGVPVFSGFQGGFGIFLGPTGGYLWGFGAMALLFWLICSIFKEKFQIFAVISGLLVCYICGACWMAFTVFPKWDALSLIQLCVLPYVLPDAIKLLLACLFSRRLRRWIHT